MFCIVRYDYLKCYDIHSHHDINFDDIHSAHSDINFKYLFINFDIPYKWIYWRVEYLAICLKNSVGVILIWRYVAKLGDKLIYFVCAS